MLPPEVYKRAIYEVSKEARSKVHKYHYTTLPKHQELLKRVENNPRTLFVIVADEAHAAITHKIEDETENDTGYETNNFS